jgi:hypothetical protein
MAGDAEQFGPYKRVRRLGIGGMAETFLAVQRGTAGFEQRVCMKFILPGYRENADFRRLFLREASIAASLRHSNIVGVIDVNEAAGYLVLELVDGVDLRALLNAAPNHRLSPAIASLITIELCKALAFAHGRRRRGQLDGIVHRDLSPSNVLISYAGEVKLTDFGVARAMRADAEPLSTTVKGKLCYMSPEQARGQILDGRSDLFSLGVVLYELLTGTRPFDGSTDAETLLRVTAGQHTPLHDVAPEVPAVLASIVERLLARDRDQRFASADACVDAFARFTPNVVCFRELGQLARAARPHQTLSGADIDAELDAEPGWPRGSRTETEAVSGHTGPVRGGRDIALTMPSELRSETGRAPGVHRNAWFALGASLVMLLVVGSAWVTHLLQQNEHAPITQVAPRPLTPPAAAGNPIAAPAPSEQPPSNEPQINLQLIEGAMPQNAMPSVRDAPRRDAPPRDQTARETSGRDAPARDAPAREATLDVGVVPSGQIWIDGKLIGWTPQLNLKIRSGRHVVAGGQSSPSIRRPVSLRAGEHKQVTINLEPGASQDE